MAPAEDREARALARARDRSASERAAELSRMRAREDFIPELEYFLGLMGDTSMEAIKARVQMPVAAIMCLQAPIELFYAHGFFPVKVYSGSYPAASLTAARLPALTCPTVKAVLGAAELDPGMLGVPWVVPLTCDWMARFKETRGLFGGFTESFIELEVPRLRDGPRSRELWLAEVGSLSDFLAGASGKRAGRRDLLRAIRELEGIRRGFLRLTDLRRAGLVECAWYSLVVSCLFLDLPSRFLENLDLLLAALSERGTGAPGGGPGVFLTGSPIYFPNFKIFSLLGQAGLRVLGDDLCSSERLIPRHVEVTDASWGGLLTTLAGAYHQGCLCPVFADGSHRAAIIREAAKGAEVKGVVFHLLKGCHPYDLDSFVLEEAVRGLGLKFLRVETDYSLEDSQNILTRLEAFRPTLETRRAV
jgi:benzoyl-CoA reductase/2-hydroxyglutaryl-CoA dehydratase subunit BcrC/BadD/HgdB